MTLPAVGDSVYPTVDETRDAILRTIKLGYQRRGLTANVLPGSDHYIRAEAIARRIVVAMSNNRLALQQFSPLTATEDDLDNIAGIFGITRRGAASAAGYVTIQVTSGFAVTIPASYQCTAPDGHKYQTTGISAGVINGAKVQIQAVEGGASTDQDAATVVTWDSAAIGHLKQIATVDIGGLDGGADEDIDEVLRARLIDRLSFPQAGGNAAQVKAWAEESTSAVEKAYVYCAARGAGSYDVAVTAAGGDRTLSSTIVNTVQSYVLGKMPGPVDLNTTSVQAQQVDVVLYAKLALPINSGGAGGGWRDAAPWPSGTFTGGVDDGKITSYAASVATVRATTAPVAGQHIAIWNWYDQVMDEYVIALVGGGIGAWTIRVIDDFNLTTGFTSVSGCYVSPGAVNVTQYATDFLAKMEALGPGEKTDSVDILPRARRYPGTDFSEPSDITATLLAPMLTEHPEIADLSYAARYATGSTILAATPNEPITTADPPMIFQLKHFGLRRTA